MIIANGDTAAIKSLTNQVVSAIAKFIVCDGNSCHSEDTPIWQTVASTPGSSQTTTGIEVVGYNRGTGVQTAGNSNAGQAIKDPARLALEEAYQNTIRAINETQILIQRNEENHSLFNMFDSQNERTTLNKRHDALIQTAGRLQNQLGQNSTAGVMRNRLDSVEGISDGPSFSEEYAAAKEVRWVQIGQTTCYVIAGAAGGYVFLVVATPIAIAASKSALISAASVLDMAAMDAALAGGGAAATGGTGGLGGLLAASGGGGAVIVYVQTRPSSGTLTVGNSPASQAVMYRYNGLKGAQDYNLRPIQLQRCVNDEIIIFGYGSNIIEHPYGTAYQSLSPEALELLASVKGGQVIYRGGNFPKSAGAEGQFWSPRHPLTPGFADSIGAGNLGTRAPNFILGGRIMPGGEFITRPAPGFGINRGGSLEVVPVRDGVQIEFFVMP